MPRGSRGQTAEPTVGDDARERILGATERCVERYGLRKTTIDDVACEVGLSRPSIYRYFADRDDLLIELITRHARELIRRTHRATSRRGSASDQIIESILYIGELGRRDSLTRHMLDPDSSNLGRRMIASGRSETIRAELFDPYLDAAVANNQLPLGFPRPDAHMWLGHVVKIVMRGLDDGEGDLERYRSILRRFVAPAFAGPGTQGGIRTTARDRADRAAVMRGLSATVRRKLDLG
jgi:AcrR family transcriptional regulator